MNSDSEDTIILPVNDDEPSDSEVENILKKYGIGTSDDVKNNFRYNPDSANYNYESYDSEWVPQTKKVKKDCGIYSNSESLDVEDVTSTCGYNNFGPQNQLEPLHLKKQIEVENKRTEKALQKEKRQQEVELRKTVKNMERDRKKEEMEKQKSMKNALRTIVKNTKPDECIKYIVVEIALEVSQNPYGMIIQQTLQANNIHFKIKSQAVPNIISWSRKVHTIDDTVLKENEVNECNALLILNEKEFAEHVNKDNLTVYIQNILSLTNFKQLTMVIVGTGKPKPNHKVAIMKAQMLTKTYFRCVTNVEQLGDLVVELTKAVAQIPFKLKKEEKYSLLSQYFSDTNKDTVRVDKNGHGLKRLWQQMLTMFPMARLETAEAITAVYPTPRSLLQAYETCDAKAELLQDLTIRRAYGPCISSKRIGPELSRKCSNFFCSTDNKYL